MKISEKQIFKLMEIVHHQMHSNSMCPLWKAQAAYILEEISNQQSDEIKEIK